MQLAWASRHGHHPPVRCDQVRRTSLRPRQRRTASVTVTAQRAQVNILMLRT